MFINHNHQSFCDSAFAAIVKGKKDYFGFARNPKEPSIVSLLGEGSVGGVLKLRLSIRTQERKFVYDETNFQGNLLLYRGNDNHVSEFVLADDDLNCLVSSFEDEIDFHLIAFIVTHDMLTPEGELRPNREIPHVMNARFSIHGGKRRIGVVSILRSEPIATLWDYESDLIKSEC